MSLLKFTAKKFVAMFIVLIAVTLITTVVVGLNIELSLENRIRQEVMREITENPSLCYEFSSMESCIDSLVKERLGK